jgi:hypothetical protein
VSKAAVKFDCKLQWSEHVAKATMKENRGLNALRKMRKHFNTSEKIKLTIINYYSVLIYNSEIWQSSNQKESNKHNLFRASAKALRMCLHCPKNNIDVHKITKRATPSMFNSYKSAL